MSQHFWQMKWIWGMRRGLIVLHISQIYNKWWSLVIKSFGNAPPENWKENPNTTRNLSHRFITIDLDYHRLHIIQKKGATLERLSSGGYCWNLILMGQVSRQGKKPLVNGIRHKFVDWRVVGAGTVASTEAFFLASGHLSQQHDIFPS